MIRFLAILILLFCITKNSAVKAQESDSYIIKNLSIPQFEEYESKEFIKIIEEHNDTLYDALSIAYANNPTLRAARAELLVVNEQLSQAQSGYKPTITAGADITHTNTETEGNSFITSDGGNTSKSGALNLNQPIYRGGSTMANVSRAKNVITAQSLALSATEQNLIYQAAEAYMNVLQDRVVLGLNEKNRILVSKELEQAKNRFKVGEITRTDVSQSEARLAAADADVITTKGNFKSSIAKYRKIVGAPPPKDMSFPASSYLLPDNLDGAIALAESNNREILQAKYINAAAEDNVNNVFGELLPQVSAIGQLNKVYDQSDFIDEQEQGSIGLSASIPLYQAGSTRSRVREAKKTANQRYIQIIEATDNAKQETISAWESWEAAQHEVEARKTQIKAAQIAREGVHYEEEFGERTTLDALNANQELLDAQVSLITAMRNEVVARFALARALGILVPQNLGFSSITP